MKDNKPMTKKEFVNLLQEVLKERQDKNETVAKPYNFLYNKCILGYEITEEKVSTKQKQKIFLQTTEKNNKVETTVEAPDHLNYVLESLIKCFGKTAVAQALKKL